MIRDKEQIEVDNNNELMAMFAGWEKTTRLGIQCFVKDDYRKYHCDLKYNSDWNELMRAWYHFVDLRFTDSMHHFKHSELKSTVGFAILYGDIKLAFSNLAEAIKWYNTTK